MSYPYPEEDRARSLLLAHLTPVQQAHLQNRGFFTVQSPSGRWYRITSGGHLYEEFYYSGGAMGVRSRCIVPKHSSMPPSDIALAILLLVQGDEEYLRNTAR